MREDSSPIVAAGACAAIAWALDVISTKLVMLSCELCFEINRFASDAQGNFVMYRAVVAMLLVMGVLTIPSIIGLRAGFKSWVIASIPLWYHAWGSLNAALGNFGLVYLALEGK